ncbi:MAG TPA: thioredoxin family protein [Kofleriaceae bacterium]|jgi:thiol-disulfide isomerase/thioredoxin|nr:thioredoxin family protein [Kofleriaceae bacterium]
MTARALARLAALAALVAGSACGATAAPAAPAAPAAAPAIASGAPALRSPDKIVQLNTPGAAVDVVAALPAGYVTVVDFWSQSCEACGPLGQRLETGVADEHRVVIRKVDVGDGDTPVATAYQIAALPHFFIYDKQKRLRYDLVGPDCLAAARYARELATE